jgi:hypothetical protein
MQVILSVPDEGYFERTWWRLFWANLMKVILGVPDEGYARNPVVRNKFDIYVPGHPNYILHVNRHLKNDVHGCESLKKYG